MKLVGRKCMKMGSFVKITNDLVYETSVVLFDNKWLSRSIDNVAIGVLVYAGVSGRGLVGVAGVVEKAAEMGEKELPVKVLMVLTTWPACHPSLVSCLPSLEESLPSMPDAYGQSLKALSSQSAASGSESRVPGAMSK
nr:hypothetical protein [Tanacetum cinerariifolium]